MNDVRRACLVAAVVAALGLATAGAQTISIVDDANLPRFEVASAPSLFTAVQEQLGLKLAPAKVPLDRLVIDHIERPDPD